MERYGTEFVFLFKKNITEEHSKSHIVRSVIFNWLRAFVMSVMNVNVFDESV